MGSNVMEPDDISSYVAQGWIPISNATTICAHASHINSRGFLHHANFLNFSVPLLLLQCSMASGIILFTRLFLKPLGHVTLVAQILGGMVLLPTILAQFPYYISLFFPLRGFVVLDLLASFGFMLYFFLVGVPIDPSVITKIDRRSFGIGFASVATPMVLSTSLAAFLMKCDFLQIEVANSLPVIAQLGSVLAFPTVAQFLSELRIINSEFGGVALSSSVVSMLCSMCVITTTMLLHQSKGEAAQILQTMGNAVGLSIAIIVIIRPAVSWILKNNPERQPLRQKYVVSLFIAVIYSGSLSHALGLNPNFGPFVLGLAIPPGPPIGSAMVEKLELVTYWMFMPLYFVKTGLTINVFAVNWRSLMVVLTVALVSVIGKFIGAFLTSACYRLPIKDAVSLGLVMNAQGIIELGLFKTMKKNKAIDHDSFAALSLFMVFVVGIITPIIRFLYDPSRKYEVYSRRTVMHLRPNSELRVISCIYDQENVPTIITILEALNPTKRSPLIVHILHLIELVGRATPLVITHKLSKKPFLNAISSECVVNAFRNFEQSNLGQATILPFTVVDHPETMHEDVCMMALDKRSSLIILPYYQSFLANGAPGACKMTGKFVNKNVLANAPCSVAILVDRGLTNASKALLERWSLFRVAVLFLGGDDDREAIAIGAWMARHPHIHLTVIRLLENGSIRNGCTKSDWLDNDMVREFRTNMGGNGHVIYVEEVVMDGIGTVATIRSMANKYELVLVGRRHDSSSPLMMGLQEWDEHEELGTVGGILATADYLRTTTVMVVQQQCHNNVENDEQDSFSESFICRNKEGEPDELPCHVS